MRNSGEYEPFMGSLREGEASEAYSKRRSSDSCGNPRHRISWVLVATSIISQSFPLLLIGLIFTASAWLAWVLKSKPNLNDYDWDRLYQLVGRRLLAPHNWFICSLVLGWCLLELAVMLYTGYMISHNRVLYRSHGRAYVLIHVFGAFLKLWMLAYVVTAGIMIISHHINGPENFLKGWQ